MRCIRAGEVSDAASAHGQAWLCRRMVQSGSRIRAFHCSVASHSPVRVPSHSLPQAMLAQLTADRSIIFYVSKAFEDFKDMEDNPVELSAEPVYGTKFLKETTADPLIRR